MEAYAREYTNTTIDWYKNVTSLDVVVTSDEAWESVFGQDSLKEQTAKSQGGKIYLPYSSHTWSREELTLALYHEGTHIMKQLGFQPYLELVDEVGGYVNFGSEDANELIIKLMQHTKVTMDQFMEDEKSRRRVYDELCATISGYISANQFEGEFNGKNIKLSDFFHSEQEFDQFVGRLKQVQDAFNARGESKKK